MKLPGPPLPRRNLSPGDLIVTSDPQWVITLLGSCVAVTMFSRRFKIAAICHGMLPYPRHPTSPPGPDHRPFRYLNAVIPAMLDRMRRPGLELREIEVKMFGGANLISLAEGPQSEHWIGSENVTVGRSLLLEAGLKIRADDVGGHRGRKIVFNTATGEVLHKFLGSLAPRRKLRRPGSAGTEASNLVPAIFGTSPENYD